MMTEQSVAQYAIEQYQRKLRDEDYRTVCEQAERYARSLAALVEVLYTLRRVTVEDGQLHVDASFESRASGWIARIGNLELRYSPTSAGVFARVSCPHGVIQELSLPSSTIERWETIGALYDTLYCEECETDAV